MANTQNRTRMIRLACGTALTGLCLAFGLTACSVGPDYQRPDVVTPGAFKEAGVWVVADPAVAETDRGAWWLIFNDPILDTLERQVEINNQNIKQAEAVYRSALAAADITRAGLFPTVGIGGSGERSGNGGSGSGVSTGTGTSTTAATNATNSTTTSLTSTGISNGPRAVSSFDLSASASWTVDLWGKIRHQVENEQDIAQADAALIANARLSAQALLATDYFALQVQDRLLQLLNQTVADDKRILTIISNQYKVGVAAQADVLAAKTQLEGVNANAINVGIARAQYEHAIAVLTGQAPSDFTLPPQAQVAATPMIPASFPSVILQRRPDIASAERQMAAANAEIGVAEAAYYPDLTLSASYGVGGSALSGLFSAASTLWSFGASATETLIDFGARNAASAEAQANYDAAVAQYRQTVLTAFQNIEDNLAAQRILASEVTSQQQATTDAQKSETISLNQYRAGIVPYNTVLTAQIVALGDEETLLTLQGNRLAASVALIEGLGGGWRDSDLPASGPTGFLPIPDPIAF